uniref:Uncharacterized protein n=1 Tax=Chrysemys picta bellii TaxID=8478 RepID=A0A8C3ID90_CHRPI
MYAKVSSQCHTKIKELRQAYQKAREANGRSGSQPHTFCFYHELHAIMGGDATTTPPLSVDTFKEGVAWSEEEDHAQAASRESVFRPSQELFLRLEVPVYGFMSHGIKGWAGSLRIPIGISTSPTVIFWFGK